jgi:hypothetical protein
VSAGPVNLTQGIVSFVADSSVQAIIDRWSENCDTIFRLLEEGFKIMSGLTLPDPFPSS